MRKQFKDSLREAVTDLNKKRLHSIPSKFRDPAQSDKDVSKEQSKQRRVDNKHNKLKLEAAKKNNMEYFTQDLNSIAQSGYCTFINYEFSP